MADKRRWQHVADQLDLAQSHFCTNTPGGRNTFSQTEKAVFFPKADICHTLGNAGMYTIVYIYKCSLNVNAYDSVISNVSILVPNGLGFE